MVYILESNAKFSPTTLKLPPYYQNLGKLIVSGLNLGAVDNSLDQTEIVNFGAPYRSICC